MEAQLKQARKEYPRNSLFYSATENIKSPITVTSLRIAENFKGIVNSEGGVIYDYELNKWAVKI